MSRGQISRSCVLPARCLPGRLQYPHGCKARRCAAHGKPVPPGFQPPEICCKRKGQTAHALPQCQKTVVHPCVRQAEQIGGKGGQHCCKAGIAEGKPRITGDHPPALRKRKPCRKPQRHRKQQQIGGPAANFIGAWASAGGPPHCPRCPAPRSTEQRSRPAPAPRPASG